MTRIDDLKGGAVQYRAATIEDVDPAKHEMFVKAVPYDSPTDIGGNIVEEFKAGGGAVQADHARAPLAFDHIGFEALTIVVVNDLHPLAFHEVGGVQQVQPFIRRLGRRDLFDQVGGFDEGLPACEDYDLWLRVTARFPVFFIPQQLIVKRGGHPGQCMADGLVRTGASYWIVR